MINPATRSLSSFAIVGLLFFAGCLDLAEENGEDSRFNGDWEPGPSRQCIEEVCLTDPEAPYARYVKEEYDLDIIADSPLTLFPRDVDGNWAVFQHFEEAAWIVAYNISGDYLVEPGGRGDYHQTRTHLVDGRAVIHQEPEASAEIRRSHMLLWDLESNESRVLETGLNGTVPGSGALGFDGQWALFANRGSDVADENALWGLDVDSGELVQVYRVPDEPDEDGWEERLGLAGIYGGEAFYALRQSHPEYDYRYVIGSVDLASGNRTIHYEGDIRVGAGPELAVGPKHVVWSAGDGNGLWALEIATKEIYEFSQPGEANPSPEIGGSWAVYKDSTYGQRGLITVNLDTGERREIRAGEDDISFGTTRTDGKRIVGSITISPEGMSLPHQNFRFPYWIDLDDIE